MADIPCLQCKKAVTSGENCKCSGSNDQQYSLPRLHALGRKIVENMKAKEKCLSTSIDNYSNLCSEFQQIQIKKYETVKLAKNENNEESISRSYINSKGKSVSFTEETSIKGKFQNQPGHSISDPNFTKTKVYSGDFSSHISTEHFETDYKIEKHFGRNLKQNEIFTPNFFQQRKCEINNFDSTDQALSKECKMVWDESKFPPFSLEENLAKNSLGAAKQETNFGKNNFSKAPNLSVDTNCWPFSKESFNKMNEKSERNLTESFNLLQITSQPIHESRSQSENESTKDAKNLLGPSASNSNLLITQNKTLITDKTYECEKYKKKFNRKSLPKNYKSDTAKNLFVSGNSQTVISNKNQLKRHKRAQTCDKPFTCDVCKKSFTFNCHLKSHYRTHTNEKPFVCEKCKKAFTQKSQLVSHCQIHSNEKPYVCDICGKGFAQKRYLSRHYRTHTGEKPYECELCKKRFALRTRLKSHCRTHTDEKPYECNICEKRFANKSNLNSHHRAHTGEKLYECNICEKRFAKKSNLNSHYLTHSDEKL